MFICAYHVHFRLNFTCKYIQYVYIYAHIVPLSKLGWGDGHQPLVFACIFLVKIPRQVSIVIYNDLPHHILKPIPICKMHTYI